MTATQRIDALRIANEIRLRRSRVRHAIHSGEVGVVDVLRERPDEVLRWEVGNMLAEQRYWGAVRVDKLLHSLHISWNRPIGQLTERQVRLLIGRLEAAR